MRSNNNCIYFYAILEDALIDADGKLCLIFDFSKTANYDHKVLAEMKARLLRAQFQSRLCFVVFNESKKEATNNILSLYAKGRISLSKAAELLDLSVHDVLRLAKQHQILEAVKQNEVR